MGKKNRFRYCLCVLLCTILFMSSPLHTVTAVANLDPNVLNGSSSSKPQEQPVEEKQSSSQVYKAETNKTPAVTNKYEAEINKISDKMKDLEAEKKKIQAEISATKSAKEKEIANKQNLDRQIGITSDEIALLQNRISLLEEDIAQKELEISVKQSNIDQSYKTFKTRLRVMQMNDSTTLLGLVLGADSFSDFLTRTQTVSRIAQHDDKLMKELTAQRKELEEAKKQLEANRTQVLDDKEETEQKKQTLNTQVAAAKLAIQDMEQMEKEYLADLEANKKRQAEMQAELDNIYAKMKWDENPYVGGELAWPVPGAYKITSGYGWRFNNSNFHTGIDITYNGGGTYGATIVAANDGTVSFVNWKYTPGKGYGIFLIIDHGGKVSTLYGHCSNIMVNVGDKVKKGQPVAQVGSTGWSTGPHLHFEVRENGVHKPPLNYLTKS